VPLTRNSSGSRIMAALLPTDQAKKSRKLGCSLVGMKLTREMKNLPQPLKLLEEAR